MKKRFLDQVGFVLFLAVAALAGLFASKSFTGQISDFAHLEPAAGQEEAGQDLIGSFTLTDHDGRPVTERDYAGQYRLVFFGFTSCPEVCPAGLKKIARTLELLGGDGEKIQPLFITVDPERDTPETMKPYLALYHPRLIGLTGTRGQISAAQDAFKVYAAKQESEQFSDYTIDHSAFIYLQDPEGRLIEFFGSEEDAAAIAADVARILNERKAG